MVGGRGGVGGGGRGGGGGGVEVGDLVGGDVDLLIVGSAGGGGGRGVGTAFPDFFQRDGHVGVDVLFRRAVGGGGSKIGGVGAGVVEGIW